MYMGWKFSDCKRCRSYIKPFDKIWLVQMTIVNKVSYKTVSKAELGLSKSHMTHIGFAENTFDEWKKRISIKMKLNIFLKKI